MMNSIAALSAFVATLAIAIHPQPAAAQTATNLKCQECVNSNEIRNGSVRMQDLAPDVLFGETIFVSSAGSAAASCNRLRNALAQVDASATHPVLIKLERGFYHCGSAPLALKRFVTIEGAGRSFSTITGNVNGFEQGIVNGAHDAALRHLTVEHRANGSGGASAIYTEGRRMSLTDIAVTLDSATVFQGYGIYALGGSLNLTNVSIQTRASAGQSVGIRGGAGAKLNMMNTWVHNHSGAVGSPAALELQDSSATGFGILFSSNAFGLLGINNSTFMLVGGTVIGPRGTSSFTGSFTCIGIADGADFTALNADCL